MLRRLRPFTTPKQISQIANSIINSQILYLAPLWALTTQQNINLIQKAQTRVLRQISWKGRKKKEQIIHRQDLFDEWNWPNTRQLIENATTSLVRKAITKSTTPGINKMFKLKDNNNTRSDNKHLVTTDSTKLRKGPNLLDRGRTSYNNLPEYLRNLSLSILGHKKQLKTYIKTIHHLPRH